MLNGKTRKARQASLFCDSQTLIIRFYYVPGGVLR